MICVAIVQQWSEELLAESVREVEGLGFVTMMLHLLRPLVAKTELNTRQLIVIVVQQRSMYKWVK